MKRTQPSLEETELAREEPVTPAPTPVTAREEEEAGIREDTEESFGLCILKRHRTQK